uniref:RNA helicase n=1 Tax=Strombidium rassoulzadegani TaxID=1082188 RepID=A0A7S3CMN0_9SPIT|mmetsp:Transcript_17493/g.29452  ORF Transcript_17493/g.29452 Transcript_17493/m.29452 type:complete len:267 (+) Transcript_17493:1086-1886(+)
MQPQIEETVRQVMTNDVVKVQIGIRNSTSSKVTQHLTYCGSEEQKLATLRQQLQDGYKPPLLIFVQSKERAKQLFKELRFAGMNVESIHADKKKEERDEIIKRFRVGQVWILICTDLMSRGIDFKTVNEVLNYDFPQSLVSYIHRIGRTGRGGREGKATTYFTDDDKQFLRTIANVMHKSGQEVQDWMLKLPQCETREWKRVEKVPTVRKIITSRPKANVPKRFLKKVEKNMKKMDKFKIPATSQEFEADPADTAADDDGFTVVTE